MTNHKNSYESTFTEPVLWAKPWDTSATVILA